MDLDIIALVRELGIAGILIIVFFIWRLDWIRHENTMKAMQDKHEAEIKTLHSDLEVRLSGLIAEGQSIRKAENESRDKHTQALTQLATVIERCNRTQ